MLLAVRISSYGCTWEVWRALKKLELHSAIASCNSYALVHGPIVILVPTRGTKDDCCKLIAHKVEIENLYDNLSVGVAFRVFFSCKSAGNDL